MTKAVIFFCDYTGIAAQPWLESGYDVYLFDTQYGHGITRTKQNNGAYVNRCGYPIGSRDFFNYFKIIIFNENIYFAGAFPPCTDLAVSGAAHFAKKKKANKDFQHEAMRFFSLCENLCKMTGAPYFVENPVSVISTMYRKPDHIFHPYFYGRYLPENDRHPMYPDYIEPRDAYPKKTCLWTGEGFAMPECKHIDIKSGYSKQHKSLGGKSLKTKNIRSATPRGFSRAVYEANKPYII